MKPKVVFLTPLVIFSLIKQSSSAIMWRTNVEKTNINDYTISRDASPYRGKFLSLSDAEKSEMCRDFYYTLILKAIEDSDSEGESDQESGAETETTPRIRIPRPKQTENEVPIPVTVANISVRGRTYTFQEDLMITCKKTFFPHQPPGWDEYLAGHQHFMASAFRTNWMYLVYPVEYLHRHMVTVYYLGLSPEHVQMDQAELEERYVEIRRQIDTLAVESSEYVQLVQQKDNFLGLSKWQRLDLCASVMASRAYQKEGEEFSFLWFDQWRSTNKPPPTYEHKPISFNNKELEKEDWTADLVYCEGWIHWRHHEKDVRHFYLTRTFDDKDSIISLIVKNGRILLDKYFRNVHIFQNAREQVPYEHLTSTYSY